MFKSKLHRATVTHADLEYEGSLTISAELMDAARIYEHEEVHVWNVTRGTRLTTYALRGPSGTICANGAAAHLVDPGDKVIIATFAEVPVAEVAEWEPMVVLLGEDNQVVTPRHSETPGPRRVSLSRVP
ncbi:MAG: aspartate 1-decarboxylase [Nannocystaceae bacterium]